VAEDKGVMRTRKTALARMMKTAWKRMRKTAWTRETVRTRIVAWHL
jgi:hypothetical protein